MNQTGQVSYTVDFAVRQKDGNGESKQAQGQRIEKAPRIARLVALAIRIEGLIGEQKVRDYASVVRLGKVTRARMTQILQLRYLAPDIQEQILFLPADTRLEERNLRSVSRLIDWAEQRRRFQELSRRPAGRSVAGIHGAHPHRQ